MTWYEWGMYALRLHKDRQRDLAAKELQMELTRQFMALFANANRGKNQTPFKPQDFWRLSYDTQMTPSEAPTLEMFDALVKKHGKRRKKNGNDK